MWRGGSLERFRGTAPAVAVDAEGESLPLARFKATLRQKGQRGGAVKLMVPSLPVPGVLYVFRSEAYAPA